MNKRISLLIISLLFVLGGIVRLLTSESVFKIFAMAHRWSSEPFFLYAYRLLGAFVILIGIRLFFYSKDVFRHRVKIRRSLAALVVFLVLSMLTGWRVGLEPKFFFD